MFIIGKHAPTLLGFIEQALKIMEDPGRKINVKVNPQEFASVPFKKRKELDGLNSSTFFDT